MQINWFVITAQIFNFLLLLFILKKLLYKPVFNFMEKRRGQIEKRIRDAEEQIQEGEKKQEEYIKKIAEFEEEKKKRKAKMISDLAKKKEDSLKKMKSELRIEQEKIDKQLIGNRKKLIENVNKVIAEKFIKFTESIFGSLANHQLEEKMVELFVIKLKTLDKKTILDLNNFIIKNNGVIDIFTAFALSKKSSISIKSAISKIGVKFKKIKFEINSDLLIGVELKVGNVYVTWNIKEILRDLKTELS